MPEGVDFPTDIKEFDDNRFSGTDIYDDIEGLRSRGSFYPEELDVYIESLGIEPIGSVDLGSTSYEKRRRPWRHQPNR